VKFIIKLFVALTLNAAITFVVMGFSFKYFAIPYMDRNLIETFKFIDSQRVDHTLDEWLETEPKPNASQEQ
tara:strand:+ start:387 stop:599 length:213 start_codon:yes stop_codon:yes gene_type:complete